MQVKGQARFERDCAETRPRARWFQVRCDFENICVGWKGLFDEAARSTRIRNNRSEMVAGGVNDLPKRDGIKSLRTGNYGGPEQAVVQFEVGVFPHQISCSDSVIIMSWHLCIGSVSQVSWMYGRLSDGIRCVLVSFHRLHESDRRCCCLSWVLVVGCHLFPRISTGLLVSGRCTPGVGRSERFFFNRIDFLIPTGFVCFQKKGRKTVHLW